MKKVDVKGTLRNLLVALVATFVVYAGLIIHNNKQEFKDYQYQAYMYDVAKNLESARDEFTDMNFGNALTKLSTASDANQVTYYKCYVTYPLSKLLTSVKEFGTNIALYLF